MLLAALAFILSLGGLVRVSALPAEARIQETWFAYSQDMRITYTAQVKPGSVYPGPTVAPEELLRVRAPGEPPTYRRVLVAQLTDTIRFSVPYSFRADRPSQITATYRIDGTLTAPNLWQRPYPLLPPRDVTVNGTELVIRDMEFHVPVGQLTADLQRLAEELRLSHDQLELRVRPVVELTVDGLREPVTAGYAPEFTVLIRNPASVEVDDPKVLNESKSLTSTRVSVRTMKIFGREVLLSTIRTASLIGLTIVALALSAMLVLQWMQRRARSVNDLRRLGNSLIPARHFTVPPDAAMVDLSDAQQLLALHLRTDRPVVQSGNAYYLVDGNTCYRFQARQE